MTPQDWRGEHFIRTQQQLPEETPTERMRPPPSRAPRTASTKEIARRRSKVRVLIGKGLTASEIGQRLNVPSATIYKDAKKIGLKCPKAKKDT